MSRRMCPLVCIVLVILVGGCGADEPVPSFAEWDSANVRIAYSTSAAWGETPAWRISDEPALQIGVVEGVREEQFTRITSAFRVPDGRIVIVNFNHPPEIRIFSKTGDHLVSAGRSGKGPGEFAAIGWVEHVGGDSLLAYDYWNSRLTYFNLDGELLGTVPLTEIAGEPANSFSFRGVFSDGSLLARPNVLVPRGAEGHGRTPTPLMRVRPREGTIDTLLVIPGAEYYVTAPGKPAGLIPFGLRSAYLAAGDRLFVGTAEQFRIDTYDLDGRLLRSIRKEHTRRLVREEDFQALRQRELAEARSPDQKRRIERKYRELPHGEHMPAHDRQILLDAAGNLWVQEYKGPADESVRWSVFNPEGRFLGIVPTPAQLRILQIERAAVLGVWTDTLGVESVRVYELVKETV